MLIDYSVILEFNKRNKFGISNKKIFFKNVQNKERVERK